jgi:hypothetical protein
MWSQQVQNRGIKGRHSLPKEQRMQCVSRCKIEGPRADTYQLDSKGCCVSMHKMEALEAGTHFLKSRG